MKAHTALVIGAAFSFNDCEEFTNLLRLPVTAFYTMQDVSVGSGSSSVEPEEAEYVADTLYSLSELVAMAAIPEDVATEEQLRAWVTPRLGEIRQLLESASNARTLEELLDTSEALREATQLYAAGVRGFDAAQPVEP
jgi:hypothetical protein